MGLSNGDIKKVFLIKGLIIGVVGSLSGSALAVILSVMQNTFKWIKVPEDVYFMDFIPLDVNWMDIGIIILFALITSVLAALWPTIRVGQIAPATALKYE